MSSAVRELLGDLIVTTTEILDADEPPSERWMWLAIESALAVRARPDDTSDLLATLDPLVWSSRFATALDKLAQRPPWPRRCLARSTLELLRDLYPDRDVDTSELELAMIVDGPLAFVAAASPEGVPEHHWWWHCTAPPGELRMNSRMADLLALGATRVPEDFRRLVANGFVVQKDCVFFREFADEDGEDKLLIQHDRTGMECDVNSLRVHRYLPPDDSRRPVDLAGSALASARWLAAELRRFDAHSYRIIVNVRREDMTSRLRFHRLRSGESWILYDDLEGYLDEGLLVLDSRDSRD